jgi:hypothetical protein
MPQLVHHFTHQLGHQFHHLGHTHTTPYKGSVWVDGVWGSESDHVR